MAKANAPKMAGLTAKKKTPVKKAPVTKANTEAPVTTDVSKDLLVNTSTEIENLTKAKALKLAPELIDVNGMNDFKLGGVLARIQEESWWEGSDHESFKEYVEAVLGIAYRKAMYLANIYDKLTEAGVKWADVSKIGWSKLRFIVNHLTEKNAKQWAKRCAELNSLEIQEYVKNLEAKEKSPKKDGGEPEVKSVSTMSFKVHADQKEVIRESLDKKREEEDTVFDAVALENICLDYLNGSTGKKKANVTKGAVKKFLEAMGETDAAELLIGIYPSLGEE